MQASTRANIYLILTTAIWGLTFPIIRNTIGYINPFLFVCIRFGLAALIFLPFALTSLSQTHKKLFVGGLVLGTLNSLAYIAQTVSLQTIHSGRAAFITGFSVALIPFLQPLFRLGVPRWVEVISSFICLLGLYILTGANADHITSGDIWAFAGAIFFALTIVSVHFIAGIVKEYRLLTFYQILFTSPLALICSPSLTIAQLWHTTIMLSLVFCALFATCLAMFVQMKYQPQTTAPKAALIYTLEPFFASIFGFILNNEPITANIATGGLIILVSLVLPELKLLIKSFRT